MTDPLDQFMAQVRRHPVLTHEEQAEIGQRYMETKDPALRNRLITANLRLVVKIAKEYKSRDVLDLVQEGAFGLCEAVDRWDPTRGVHLTTYASWWVRAFILARILRDVRLVKIGTTEMERKVFFRWPKLQGLSDEEISQSVGMNPRQVADMRQRLAVGECSLDTPWEGGRTIAEELAAPGPAMDEQIADAELLDMFRQSLREFAEQLPQTERFVFDGRMAGRTLAEIGEDMGLSRERVRQIEAKIRRRLMPALKEALGTHEL